MAAAKLNIYIEAGATFRRVFKLTDSVTGDPYNFTGKSLRAQVRKDADTLTAYDFTFSFTNELGEVVLPSAGIFMMTMLATVSKTIPCGLTIKDEESKYQWALEEYIDIPGEDAEEVERLYEGTALISAEIVKEV